MNETYYRYTYAGDYAPPIYKSFIQQSIKKKNRHRYTLLSSIVRVLVAGGGNIIYDTSAVRYGPFTMYAIRTNSTDDDENYRVGER